MRPYRSLCVLIDFNGSLRVHMGRYSSQCIVMGFYEFL